MSIISFKGALSRVKMEGDSAVHDPQVVHICEPTVGYKLLAQREFCNQFVIEVLNRKVRPQEYSRIVLNFLARGGRVSITL